MTDTEILDYLEAHMPNVQRTPCDVPFGNVVVTLGLFQGTLREQLIHAIQQRTAAAVASRLTENT